MRFRHDERQLGKDKNTFARCGIMLWHWTRAEKAPIPTEANQSQIEIYSTFLNTL